MRGGRAYLGVCPPLLWPANARVGCDSLVAPVAVFMLHVVHRPQDGYRWTSSRACSAALAMLRCMLPKTRPWKGQTAHQ